MGFLRLSRRPAAAPLGFVLKGDSLTAGGYPGTDYGSYLAGLTGITLVNNFGTGGQTIQGADAAYASEAGSVYNAATADTYLFMMGTNNTGGDSASTIISRIQTHMNLALATGYRIALGTITKRGDSAPSQAILDAVNPSLRANYQAMGATWLMDFEQWPTLLDPTNTTYYSDLLHQTAAGRLEMAKAAKAGMGL